MSSLLFRIDKRNNTIFDKQAARLTEQCKKLSEEELRYVILVTDYYSPLKQYPKKEKAVKAKRMIWGVEGDNNPIQDDPKIKRAIEEYENLQYDPVRETIIAYKEKVQSLTSELLLANKPGRVTQIDGDIKALQTRIAEMEEDVQKAEDSVRLKKKGDSLSLIEIWQRNIETAKKEKELMSRKKLELEKDVYTED
jgi:hypothetical protein